MLNTMLNVMFNTMSITNITNVHSKNFEEYDLDLENTNSSVNPNDMLIPREFLEGMIRIAHKKFMKHAGTLERQLELLLEVSIYI